MEWSISNSLNSLQKDEEKIEAEKYAANAREYAEQGFDEDQINELLSINGCSASIAGSLAKSAFYNIPSEYNENKKPTCYADVKEIIEKNILSKSEANIRGYFDNHADRTASKVAGRVLLAKSNPTRMFLDEIHKELRPIIEDIIMTNNIVASENKEIKKASPKEIVEYELFGIWPVELIQKQARKIEIEEDIINRHVVDDYIE